MRLPARLQRPASVSTPSMLLTHPIITRDSSPGMVHMLLRWRSLASRRHVPMLRHGLLSSEAAASCRLAALVLPSVADFGEGAGLRPSWHTHAMLRPACWA